MKITDLTEHVITTLNKQGINDRAIITNVLTEALKLNNQVNDLQDQSGIAHKLIDPQPWRS